MTSKEIFIDLHGEIESNKKINWSDKDMISFGQICINKNQEYKKELIEFLGEIISTDEQIMSTRIRIWAKQLIKKINS